MIINAQTEGRWPAGWGPTHRSIPLGLVFSFLGVLVACALALAVWFVIDGEIVVALVNLDFAVLAGLAIPAWWAASGRRRRRGQLGGTRPESRIAGECTVVPFSWSRGLLWFLPCAAVMISVHLPLAMVVSVFLPKAAVFGIGFGGVLAGPLGAVTFAFMTGRFTRGYLAVYPHEVRLVANGTSSSLLWEEIAAITPSVHNGRLHFHLAAVPEHRHQVSMIRFSGDFLDVDPVLVERMLRFYFEHPEQRWELGTITARQRASTGFVAASEVA